MNFLQVMVFYAAVATLYRQAAGVTVFQITLIESISLVLSMVLELPWGMLAERMGYRRTMVICSFVLRWRAFLVWMKASSTPPVRKKSFSGCWATAERWALPG